MEKKRAETILREADALIDGHFILTSGRHSNMYMQCAKIFQYPKFAEELAQDIAICHSGKGIEAVIGPATGGIILAYEVARLLSVKNLFAEREEGKMVLRRGFNLHQGAKVLVVEDVITTGGTVQEVIDLTRDLGAQPVAVAVIVDRSFGAVSFSVPYTAIYESGLVSWSPDECPLCKEGKIPAVKPGSRGKK
ncbi:MAG: orotate phosphoribosyltransferase [Defluviitaleaceae bacterium]|nr:orotate phosphoribosyltransferase [Defluviitaleaceae bacterium]